MRIVSANITGSLILNGIDVTDSFGSSSVDSGSFTQKIDSLQSSTSSLNSFTSSINTTIKNKMDSESVISGSIQVDITGTTGYSDFSSSISSSVGLLSGSVATTTSELSTSIGGLSSSVATTTSNLSSSVGSLSSSVATTTSNLSSSIGSLSGSVATTTSDLSSSVGSLSSSVATTTSDLSSSVGSLSSSVATTTSGLAGRITTIEGNYATTGSNIFSGNQTITGSFNQLGDMCVTGNITSTGQIVAQTINVQQVTSSIVYSCGSNTFGCSLENNQVFTGSMFITGSTLTAAVGSTCFKSDNLNLNGTTPTLMITDSTVSGNGGDVFLRAQKTGVGYNNLTTVALSYNLKGGGSETSFLSIDSSGIGCFNNTVCVPRLQVNNTNSIVVIEGTATNGEGTLTIAGKNSSGTCRSAIFKYDNADIIRISTADAIPMRFETSDVTRLTIASNGITSFACRICTPGFTSTGDIYFGIGSSSYEQMTLCYSGYNGGSPIATLMPTTVPGSGALTTFLLLKSNGLGSGSGCNHMGLDVQNTTYLASCGGRVGIGTTTPCAKIETSNGGYILRGGWGLFCVGYTSDGLFSTNAQPNFISTNAYAGTYTKFGDHAGISLGYQDNGAGLYSPAYGFDVKSTDGRPVTGNVVKAIVIRDTDTNQQPFWINNNGSAYFANRIGIGTTDPGAPLSIRCDSGSGTAYLDIATCFQNAYRYLTMNPGTGIEFCIPGGTSQAPYIQVQGGDSSVGGGSFKVRTGAMGSVSDKLNIFQNGVACFASNVCANSLVTIGGGLNENFNATGGGHINRYFAVKYIPEDTTQAFFKITTSGASATHVQLVATNPGVGWFTSQLYHSAITAYWGGWIGSGTEISRTSNGAGYINGVHTDQSGGQTYCVIVANNGTTTQSLVFAYITVITYAGYSAGFTQL